MMSDNARLGIPPSPELGGYCAVVVMAKAPRAGESKTRLVPPLSATQAAMLSSCFIEDIASNIVTASQVTPIHGYVAYSPAGSEAEFRELLPAEIRLLPPRRIGLGQSLFDSAEHLLAAGYGAVCLVNADSPTLPTAMLVDAAQSLRARGDRAVLGPTSDGGYYLIGLKAFYGRLFEDIDWSTGRVFRQTLERAASIGLTVVSLQAWYDIDDLASLRRLCAELVLDRSPPPVVTPRYAAPRTSVYLRKLLASDVAERLGLDRWPMGSLSE